MSAYERRQAPKTPMVPRVTSGHQRSLETMIAQEVVLALALAEGPDTQFSAVVEGIQIACRDNGIVLTVEPGFAPCSR